MVGAVWGKAASGICVWGHRLVYEEGGGGVSCSRVVYSYRVHGANRVEGYWWREGMRGGDEISLPATFRHLHPHKGEVQPGRQQHACHDGKTNLKGDDAGVVPFE